MKNTGEGPDARRAASGQAARVMGVGLQFAGSIVLFLLLGQWLDSRLGTEPWLLIAGVMVGATAGFYALYREMTAGSRKDGEGR